MESQAQEIDIFRENSSLWLEYALQHIESKVDPKHVAIAKDVFLAYWRIALNLYIWEEMEVFNTEIAEKSGHHRITTPPYTLMLQRISLLRIKKQGRQRDKFQHKPMLVSLLIPPMLSPTTSLSMLPQTTYLSINNNIVETLTKVDKPVKKGQGNSKSNVNRNVDSTRITSSSESRVHRMSSTIEEMMQKLSSTNLKVS